MTPISRASSTAAVPLSAQESQHLVDRSVIAALWLATDLLYVAGEVTGIAILLVAGVRLHRLLRPYFVLRWIIWSYLLNGVVAALILILPTPHGDLDTLPSLAVSYGSGLLRAVFSVVQWPILWFLIALVAFLSASLRTLAAVIVGPAVIPLIGATIVPWVARRLSQRASRRAVSAHRS